MPRLAVRRYLEPLARAAVDVIVLGCTHYPLLREVIEREARALLPGVQVVDSAHATAAELVELLTERGLRAPAGSTGGIELLVTDRPRSFQEVTARFLGGPPREVQVIDL
ncbi:MAG: hypothetical protein NVS3B10_11390 [Polyangiales bacterium]